MSTNHPNGIDNASHCADLVRTYDFARYAATLFVPVEHRRPLLALYAFNVELNRIRDHISQPLPGEIRLQWWRDLIDGDARGSVEANPVAAELIAAIAQYRLPREWLSRLIDARVFDLYDDPMPSLEVLERYCDDTASRLFALSVRILAGESDEAEHMAYHAGIAQGLTAVIADLPRHTARKQLYLPQDILNECGVAEADIFAGRSTPELQAAIDRLLVEIQAQLDSALDLWNAVPEQSAPAFLPLALVRRILSQIETRSENPFTLQQPSRLRILWTMWRASRHRH